MTAILDTDKPARCGHCQGLIKADEPKMIVGYGWLIMILHPQCWEIVTIVSRQRNEREFPPDR